MTKLVTSTMFEIAFRPTASRRYCSHSGDGLDGDVFKNQRGIARAQSVVFDRDFDRRGASGNAIGFTGSRSGRAKNRGDFARHSVVAPQIGAMRQGFVIDFDDEIRRQS